VEIDDQKARERATAWANTHAKDLYRRAERKLLPRKGELGWNFVFHKALERLIGGKALAGLEKEILDYVRTPYEEERNPTIRMGTAPRAANGKVGPKFN
jgi:hypothetical protein